MGFKHSFRHILHIHEVGPSILYNYFEIHANILRLFESPIWKVIQIIATSVLKL